MAKIRIVEDEKPISHLISMSLTGVGHSYSREKIGTEPILLILPNQLNCVIGSCVTQHWFP